jgi:hypothetical protein
MATASVETTATDVGCGSKAENPGIEHFRSAFHPVADPGAL